MQRTTLHLYTEAERRYYKENMLDWVQPFLTANNSHIGFMVSATNEGQGGAWCAFSEITTDYWCTSNNTPTGSLFLQVQNPLLVTEIEVTGLQNQYGSTNTMTIYSDKAKTKVIGETKNFDYTISNKVSWVFDEPVEITSLVFDGTGTNWVCVYNIQIKASEKITSKGTAQDYTYYEDYFAAKSVPMTSERKYYKRLWRKWDYTPALTSNDSDPNFIVSADTWYTYKGGGYYPWRSFAKSKDYVYPWLSANKATGWYQIKTTAKLRIYAITIKNRDYDGNTGSMKDFEIFGSLDGVTWESIGRFHNDYYENGGQYTIDVQSKKAYYYHKFEIYSHNQTTDWCSIGFPTIYADEEYDKVEVSEDDEYDFYEDFPADIGVVSYPEVKYFRRGEEANVELYGTLQNREGKIGNYKVVDEAGVESIITEFKSGNYAITPKYPTAVTSYEVVLKFKTFAHNEGRVIGNYKNNVYAPQIEVATSATAYNLEWLHPNGSSWVIVSANSSDLVLGEWYWLKATWDGQNVRVYASTDGENYTFRNYKAITSCSWKEQVEFGADANAYFLNGEIDLKECYMIVNGKMWWRGTHPVECSKEEAEWSELVNIGKPIN